MLDALLNEVFKKRFNNFRDYLKQNGIQRLDLARKNLGTKNLSLLSKALEGTAVTAIDLSGNEIDDKGITSFAKNIEKTNLRIVNLESNEIGDKGALNFAKKLQKSKVVSWMVPHNFLTTRGINAIATALKNSVVNFIDLSGVNMGEDGAILFFKKLQGSNVRMVTLQFNQITDDQIWEIIDSIPKTNLTNIDISFNREITPEMHQRLKKALEMNAKPLLMQPYPLWSLKRLKENKPGWSNLKKEALNTPEEKFKYGTEILVNERLPREIRDLILHEVYPFYSTKVGNSYTRILDKRNKENQPTPRLNETKKPIKMNRSRTS